MPIPLQALTSIEAPASLVKSIAHSVFGNAALRNLTTDEFKVYVSLEVRKILILYYGYENPKNAIIEPILKLIHRYYRNISISELSEAFTMASAGMLYAENNKPISLSTFGKSETPDLIGSVLRAYSEYRKKIVHDLHKEKDRHELIEKEKEEKAKNEQVRLYVRSEFERMLNDGINFESVDKVPGFWVSILLESKHIKGDAEVWTNCVETIKRKLKNAVELRVDSPIPGTIIDAISAWKKMQSNPDTLPESVRGAAATLYGKSIIYKTLQKND